MRARIFIILVWLSILVGAFGQGPGTLYVSQFKGATVGDKVTAAMAACVPDTRIPCVLVIDATLATYAPGVMPSLCSQCVLNDYRTDPTTAAVITAGVNGTIYAGVCAKSVAPSWCPGGQTDVGAWIKAALGQCATGYAGFQTCTIELPPGNNLPWHTSVHIGPGVNLIGRGKAASVYQCDVAGDCLLVDHSAASGVYAHTVESNSKVVGFRINGTGATGQNIVHAEDMQGVLFEDVMFDGASESGGACIFLDDENYWTERNTFIDVTTGYNCNKGWRIWAAASSPYQPHPSFGYNRWLDIHANTAGAQTAISIEGNSYVYNGTMRLTVNKGGVGSTILHMEGGAEFYYMELHLHGEENGSGGKLLDIASASNQFVYNGDINFTAISNNITNGAVFTRMGDSGGYFVTPTVNGNAVINQSWQTTATASTLATGADLNTITACGNYEVTSPVNGPSVSPSNALQHLLVNCAGTAGNGYVEQLVWEANYTSGVPTWFARIRDGSTWYAWYQMPGPMVASGCAQYPCVVATVTPASYSGLTGTSATTLYTTPAGSGQEYRVCGSLVMTAAAATGGAFSLQANYTVSGHAQTGKSFLQLSAVTTQWADSSNLASCFTFTPDASTAVQWQLVGSSVTGSPTVLYGVTLERLK